MHTVHVAGDAFVIGSTGNVTAKQNFRTILRDQKENIVSYEFGEFCLDPSTPRLLKNGKVVTLTPKALHTLLILIENAGTAVSKNDLYRKIWSESFVEEANLTQYIYLLRRTLGDSFIETVARFGYRFTGDVKTIRAPKNEKEEDNSEAEDSEARAEGEREIATETLPNSAHQRKAHGFPNKFWALTAALLIVVGGLGWLAFSKFRSVPSNGPGPGSVRSIAVLPFRTIGEEAANQKLGLGMADAVIMRLSKLNQIPVRPTSSVFRFADFDVEAVKVGRELQVDAIMEGTVQRGGTQIRVSVQLIKVDTGETLWAEKFDGEFNHIFKVQDSISTKVADSLALSLAGKKQPNTGKTGTSNADAYEAYILGFYFWNRRNEESLRKAERHYQKAIELDPNYPQAYAGLADTYNLLAYNRYVPSAQISDKAKVAALKALELDPSLAEAHIAMAQVQFAYEHDEQGGMESLEKAIVLSPYNATVHLRYGWATLNTLSIDVAEREMRLAQEYDPVSPIHNLALCNVLVLHRKYEEAVKYCERAIELDSNVPDGRISLSNAYLLTNRNNEAVRIVSEEVSKNPEDLYAQAAQAYVYARSGKEREASEIAASLRKQSEKLNDLFLDLALVDLAIGRKDAALVNLNKALKVGRVNRATLHYDPRLDSLKADPLFTELIRRQL